MLMELPTESVLCIHSFGATEMPSTLSPIVVQYCNNFIWYGGNTVAKLKIMS
jgi:hypothetical protein